MNFNKFKIIAGYIVHTILYSDSLCYIVTNEIKYCSRKSISRTVLKETKGFILAENLQGANLYCKEPLKLKPRGPSPQVLCFISTGAEVN